MNLQNEIDSEIDPNLEVIPLIKSNKDREYPSLLVVSANGFGKQTYLSEYRKTSRGAKGVKTLNMNDKTGQSVIVEILDGSQTNLFVTTKNGITIRISLDQIPQIGRSTQGVKIIRLEKNDFVVSGSVS